MTLPEKILHLRTAQGMSQGDLAERLEVSRQSVSKWETGQSVPDLDKIIRLADLFGVSVDELVREEARPEPPQPESQIIYMERESRGLRPAQVAGIVLEVLGAGMFLLGLVVGPILSIFALLPVVLGLPLLLARKHPFLIFGWLAVGALYLIFNPYWTSVSFYSIRPLLREGRLTIQAIISVGRLILLLVMIFCTLSFRKGWRGEKDG